MKLLILFALSVLHLSCATIINGKDNIVPIEQAGPSKTVEKDDPYRVFCDPRRRVWFDKDGIATVPMGGNETAPVVEGALMKGETNTLTICLQQNKVIYGEFIRLINMQLPATLDGKCYIGCLLNQYHLVTQDDFQPRIGSSFLNLLTSLLGAVIKTVGKKFLFSGDEEIYKGIDIDNSIKLATNIAIGCLKEKEDKDREASKEAKIAKPIAKPKFEKGSQEAKDAEAAKKEKKCNIMYEFMKCAVNHKNFEQLKEILLEINVRKLSTKKRKIEFPEKVDPKSTKVKKENPFALFATYHDYCENIKRDPQQNIIDSRKTG